MQSKEELFGKALGMHDNAKPTVGIKCKLCTAGDHLVPLSAFIEDPHVFCRHMKKEILGEGLAARWRDEVDGPCTGRVTIAQMGSKK